MAQTIGQLEAQYVPDSSAKGHGPSMARRALSCADEGSCGSERLVRTASCAEYFHDVDLLSDLNVGLLGAKERMLGGGSPEENSLELDAVIKDMCGSDKESRVQEVGSGQCFSGPDLLGGECGILERVEESESISCENDTIKE